MKKKRLIIGLAAFPPAAWALYFLFGKPIAFAVAASFGERLLGLGDGKFTNPEVFVQLRLRDLALLTSVASILALACLFTATWLRVRVPAHFRWAVNSLVLFLCLNVFAAVASHTALFWCLLFTGRDKTHNYTQYQIKRELMSEIVAPRHAVLLGSSQTHAEIDKRLLNADMGKQLWTTELHFPGCSPFDMLLCLEDLPAVKVDYIIVYLSEGYFYSGAYSGADAFFMRFRYLGQFYDCGGGNVDTGRPFRYGLLGDVFPLFRLREPVISRLFGFRILSLAQERRDQSLSADLATRGKIAALSYRFGPACDFQKRAFDLFAVKCRERHARLVLCCGQLNPILGRAIDPAFRPNMLAYLHDLASHDSNVILLEESQLPVQTEKNYKDLTHVDEAAQVRFTHFIETVLQKLPSAPP
jgi:hypothetical protein